ncbi:MAG: AMP-binding protein [Deltaproteobacteria bacterium]|nr:AMP-binding protein [Deltaproteobacteria bacterium]
MSTSPPSLEAPLTLRAQIEARAQQPATESKVLLRQGERSWTYRQYRDECVRTAHFLRRRLGRIDEDRLGHVAMILENHFELLSLFGGCGYAGLTLFGVNTGLRGETLAGVLNQSRARLIVVDERFLPELERVRGDLKHVASENILVLPTQEGEIPPGSNLRSCLTSEVAEEGVSLEAPPLDVTPEQNLMVIYTSGTTGLPKGINNNHLKLCLTGIGVANNMGLNRDDVGYACMPLFHSNAMFVGFMPAFWTGGSLGIRKRFSASGFLPDVLHYGVTFWNYVGEPVHYVLAAIEKAHDGDEDRILREVTQHPKNRLRYAVGNGASQPDIDKLMRWLGLEEMFELYGSTEAAISTFRRKQDPRGSVGEITDESVKILNERGEECGGAELGPDGKITNYAEAVGEICRVAPETGLFQGYFNDPDANAAKYRDGVYHSGDLGHVLVQDGKRYLFFDGRTDDWIRKDGENFSAAQVGRLLSDHPDVELAAAYGVPCVVSDELVMAALTLHPETEFDPQGFFDFCERQITAGSMDRKWFPDFVRVVDAFDLTQTQKILVRNLKRVHFDRRRLPHDAIFWRERGDTSFKPLGREDFEALYAKFQAAERAHLLDR